MAVAILFVPLPQGDLQDDAPFYAFVPLRIAATGDVLHLWRSWGDEEPYFNKPPLHFWITAGIYKTLGVSIATARLATALSWLAVGGVLFMLLRRFGHTMLFAATAVLLVLLQREVFKNTLQCRMDGGLVLGFLVASFAALKLSKDAENKLPTWLLLGGGIGFGLLYRGAPSLMGLIVLVAFFAWARPRLLLAWRGWLTAMLAVALVGGWWFALQWAFYGDLFAERIGTDAVGQHVAAAEAASWLDFLTYYVRRIPEAYAVALAPAVLGVVHLVRRRTLPLIVKLAIVWCVVWLLLLHLSPRQNVRYALPIAPWLAIVAAFGLAGFATIATIWAKALPFVGPIVLVAVLGMTFFGDGVAETRDDALLAAAPTIRRAVGGDDRPRVPPLSPVVHLLNDDLDAAVQKLDAIAVYTGARVVRTAAADLSSVEPGDFIAVFENEPMRRRVAQLNVEEIATSRRWNVHRVAD